MTSNVSTTSFVGSTTTGTHKRNSDDFGWEYGFTQDKSNLDRLKCKLYGKTFGGGITRMKQHIALLRGDVSSCPTSTKQDEALRSELRKEFYDSVDGVKASLGLKAPNVIGPMDGYSNIILEEVLNARKGKKC
uniref:BED-type domain-containing protein n=1 Tax=Lactuca sativa TaxID=4236 RepID=A0A9R1WE45_LACSA|nr:hypothetical protein LSAT_V11C200054060 [Lactuca sativa]